MNSISANLWFGVPCVLVICVGSLFASFPYLVYSFGLPEPVWLLVCVLREIIYYIIFAAYWLHLLIDPPRLPREKVLSCLYAIIFSLVYTALYAAKWYTIENIIFREISIGLFVISWLHVFTTTAINVMTSEETQQTRAINSNAELSSYNSLEVYRKLRGEGVDRLDDIKDIEITNDKKSVIIDLFLGLSIAFVTLSLVEDYGYSIAMVLKLGNETAPLPMSKEGFLWTVSISMGIFAVMYVVLARHIAQQYMGEGFSLTMRQALWNILIRLPIFFFAGVLASIRMNSGYEIFGRIVARQGLPETLGLTLIWSGIMIVFVVDFLASGRIVSTALTKLAECIACFVLAIYSNEHCLSHRFRLLYIANQARQLRKV